MTTTPDGAAGPDRAGAGNNQKLQAALDLGWQMAELYAAVRPASLERDPRAQTPAAVGSAAGISEDSKLQPDLPGLGSLDKRQRLALTVAEVSAELRSLSGAVEAAGLPVPDVAKLVALAADGDHSTPAYDLAAEVLDLHVRILAALTAADHALGRSYGLGRALCDLCLRPRDGSRHTFTDDFREHGRVETLTGQLGELRTQLPPHAAAGVQASLGVWVAWAAHPQWHGEELDWDEHGADVVATLNQQGRLWRSVLTGQKAALDQLCPDDYLDAGSYLLGRLRHLAVRFFAQYWPVIVVIVTVVAAGIVASLHWFHSPAAKSSAVIVTFLAGLGVSWRTVTATLDRAVQQAESSLWQAELDAAVGRAVTVLPDGAYARATGEPRPPLAGRVSAVGNRAHSRRGRQKHDVSHQPPPFELPLANRADRSR